MAPPSRMPASTLVKYPRAAGGGAVTMVQSDEVCSVGIGSLLSRIQMRDDRNSTGALAPRCDARHRAQGSLQKKGGHTRPPFMPEGAASLFGARCRLARLLRFRLLLGLEILAGLLVDDLHGQPHLAALVEAEQLHLHLVAFLD